nr:MAG TPA: hypothetical protein [Siphoviridae sp. ct8TV20]
MALSVLSRKMPYWLLSRLKLPPVRLSLTLKLPK